eukprot:TRINITY_DN20544_c0_g1_i1.p1 TRINITY_DN20544_c0_g1~~TRINITY_DN20544_c0_g1_i1.p1  ORF type:complete len:269 (-),score=36.10 TRINITY_DN20544_c0_g1_i1:15-821(-)
MPSITTPKQKGHEQPTTSSVLGGPIPSNMSVMEMLKVFHTFTEECASNPTMQRFVVEKKVAPHRSSHVDPSSSDQLSPRGSQQQQHPTPNAQAPCPTPLRLPSHADLNLISPWRKGASSPTISTTRHTSATKPTKRAASSVTRVPVSSSRGAAPPPTGPTASDIVNELRKKYPLLQQHQQQQGVGSTNNAAPPCSYNGGRWPGASLVGLDLSLIHISEPTRLLSISYAVFCLKKKKKRSNNQEYKKVTKKKPLIIHDLYMTLHLNYIE